MVRSIRWTGWTPYPLTIVNFFDVWIRFIMTIRIDKITARKLARILAAEREAQTAVLNYLLCRAALEKRRQTLAALSPDDERAARERKMIQRVEDSLHAHKRRIDALKMP